MSLRAFSVFIDSPERSTSSSTKRDASVLSVLSPLPTSSNNAAEQILSPTNEKENIHPVTGLASSFQPNKKRKTISSVLSVKEQIVPEEPKSSKSKRTELSRKRSASASSSGKSKSKSSKDRKVLGTSTNSLSSASSRPRTLKPSATMPTLLDSVAEERSFEVAEAIIQTEVNSRCYDLTVSPLADVSEAYLGSQVAESSQTQTQASTKTSEVTTTFYYVNINISSIYRPMIPLRQLSTNISLRVWEVSLGCPRFRTTPHHHLQ